MRPRPKPPIESLVELQTESATLNVRHLTTYRYARPVEFGEHRMMMRPRDGHDQRLVSADLEIEPEPKRLRWLYDAFDNCVAVATFSGSTKLLRVENRFRVERVVEDDLPGGEIDPRAQALSFFLRCRRNCRTSARAMERLYNDPAGDLDRWVRRFLSRCRRRDADEPPPDDADLRDQGRLFLRAARRIRRAVAAAHARSAAAAVAATSRS